MKKQGLFKRFSILFVITLVMVLQIVSFLPQKVEAAVLNSGVTISAVDINGDVILPMTAVEISEGDTALKVLEEAGEKHDVPLEIVNDPNFGAYIANIGEVVLQSGTYWGFNINGEPGPGASNYDVVEGDSLLFKVTNYPPETVNVKVSAIDKKGEYILNEEVEVIQGSSAYDALKLAAKTADVSVDATIYSEWFAFVNNLNGVELEANDYWSPSLNGEMMNVGLSFHIVEEGNHIQLALPQSSDEQPVEEIPEENNDDPIDEETTPDPIEKPGTEQITEQQLTSAIQSTKQYILTNGISDDFAAVAVKAAGESVPKSYIDDVTERILNSDGTFRNVTEYEKIVLGLTAAGVDATNVAGYNLIEKIYSNERMTIQGNNGVIYALLAFDSGNYEVPSNAEWTREKLVNYLLEQQLGDGSWSLFGPNGSVDITGMAMSALAPYRDQEKVQSAIDQAVNWISSVQDSNGGFSDEDNGGDASETTAQVIIGLASVGIDPTDSRFVKQPEVNIASADSEATAAGINLLQHLLSFKQDNGGFSHIKGQEPNYMATIQGLLALSAYHNFLTKKGSIYQFNDPEVVVEPNQPEEPETTDQEQPTEEKTKNTDTTDQTKMVQQLDETTDQTEEVNLSDETTEDSSKDSTLKNSLPNTATSFFNILTAGAVLLVVGIAGVIYTQRRKSYQH